DPVRKVSDGDRRIVHRWCRMARGGDERWHPCRSSASREFPQFPQALRQFSDGPHCAPCCAEIRLRPIKDLRHPFPHDDMENMPVLGIAARSDAVGFLFVEHFEVEAVEEGQSLVAAYEGDAGPPGPAIAWTVPLAAEAAAGWQRLADALPQSAESLG